MFYGTSVSHYCVERDTPLYPNTSDAFITQLFNRGGVLNCSGWTIFKISSTARRKDIDIWEAVFLLCVYIQISMSLVLLEFKNWVWNSLMKGENWNEITHLNPTGRDKISIPTEEIIQLWNELNSYLLHYMRNFLIYYIIA